MIASTAASAARRFLKRPVISFGFAIESILLLHYRPKIDGTHWGLFETPQQPCRFLTLPFARFFLLIPEQLDGKQTWTGLAVSLQYASFRRLTPEKSPRLGTGMAAML